jgi:hypothetical protein
LHHGCTGDSAESCVRVTPLTGRSAGGSSGAVGRDTSERRGFGGARCGARSLSSQRGARAPVVGGERALRPRRRAQQGPAACARAGRRPTTRRPPPLVEAALPVRRRRRTVARPVPAQGAGRCGRGRGPAASAGPARPPRAARGRWGPGGPCRCSPPAEPARSGAMPALPGAGLRARGPHCG